MIDVFLKATRTQLSNATTAERRNAALLKNAEASAGNDNNHRELRMAYQILQAFYVRTATDCTIELERRESLSN